MSRSALLMILLLAVSANCGGSDVKLDATKLTLEFAYRLEGEPTANLEGQPGAAPSGASIVCRRAADHDWRLGDGEAAADGSFDIPLDARPFPLDEISSETFNTLNDAVQCRAESGPWVSPLRQPRIAIE